MFTFMFMFGVNFSVGIGIDIDVAVGILESACRRSDGTGCPTEFSPLLVGR